MVWHKRSKYGAIRTEYNGKKYHSKKEAAYAAELDCRVKAGELGGYTGQVSFPLEVNGVRIARYVVDFAEHLTDGTTIYTEVKGAETDVWKLKWKLFEALYPDLKKQIVR